MTKVWNDESPSDGSGWKHVYVRDGITYVSGISDKSLSSFTRVVEETGILDQGRSQKEKPRDE